MRPPEESSVYPSRHHVTYPRFLLDALGEATDGSLPFYTFMFVLTAVALVGANAWASQVSLGMATTHMSDQDRAVISAWVKAGAKMEP